MSPEKLARIGAALYGTAWQSELAHELGINPRTVRRWATGEWKIPVERAAELRARLDERRAEINLILQAGV